MEKRSSLPYYGMFTSLICLRYQPDDDDDDDTMGSKRVAE
jgi:hypothetical protein